MVWNILFIILWHVLLVQGWTPDYYQPHKHSQFLNYLGRPVSSLPVRSPETPMDAMVRITNNLGVAILKDQSYSRKNFAFSPYGIASVLVILYEGAQGESARQINRALGFPTEKEFIRTGFRDIHDNLKSYFSHEGYLSGINLNKEGSTLKPKFRQILRSYGYDVDDENEETSENYPSEASSVLSSMPTKPGRKATVTSSPLPPDYTAIKEITDSFSDPFIDTQKTTASSTITPTTILNTEVQVDFISKEPQTTTMSASSLITAGNLFESTDSEAPPTTTSASSLLEAENLSVTTASEEPQTTTMSASNLLESFGNLFESTASEEPQTSTVSSHTTEGLTETTNPEKLPTVPISNSSKIPEGDRMESTTTESEEFLTSTISTSSFNTTEYFTESTDSETQTAKTSTSPSLLLGSTEREEEPTLPSAEDHTESTTSEIFSISGLGPTNDNFALDSETIHTTIISEIIQGTTLPTTLEVSKMSTTSSAEESTTSATSVSDPGFTLKSEETTTVLLTITQDASTPFDHSNNSFTEDSQENSTDVSDTTHLSGMVLKNTENLEDTTATSDPITTIGLTSTSQEPETTQTIDESEEEQTTVPILATTSSTTDFPSTNDEDEEFVLNLSAFDHQPVENVTEKTKNEGKAQKLQEISTTPKVIFKKFLTDISTYKIRKRASDINNSEETRQLDNGMLIPQPDDDNIMYRHHIKAKSTRSHKNFDSDSQYSDKANPQSLRGLENKNKIAVENDIMMSQSKSDEFPKQIRSIVNRKVPLWLVSKDLKPAIRRKRSILDYLKPLHHFDVNSRSDVEEESPIWKRPQSAVRRHQDFFRSLPNSKFLVNGETETPIHMIKYTTMLPFAYIPDLSAKALEFPLDDVRYKLLILLPVDRRGLRQLVNDLLDCPLNNVIQQLRPVRVKAEVPAFMVEGFVVLTPSLENLGIRDVFDPQKANLSGMSSDPELYVRNVEQSVAVVIKNYVNADTYQSSSITYGLGEYEFDATHPFLYFVLDTATNVALMAGQIVNPFDSRIL